MIQCIKSSHVEVVCILNTIIRVTTHRSNIHTITKTAQNLGVQAIPSEVHIEIAANNHNFMTVRIIVNQNFEMTNFFTKSINISIAIFAW